MGHDLAGSVPGPTGTTGWMAHIKRGEALAPQPWGPPPLHMWSDFSHAVMGTPQHAEVCPERFRKKLFYAFLKDAVES